MSNNRTNSKEKELNRRRGITNPAATSQSRPGRAHNIAGSDGKVLTDHSTKLGRTKGLESVGDDDDDDGNTTAGRQYQKDLKTKGSFLPEDQQKTEARIPDDPCTVEVQFPSSLNDDNVNMRNDDCLGQSVWFHMLQIKADLDCLREKLKTEDVFFTEESAAPDTVRLQYFGERLSTNIDRKEKADSVFNLLRETAKDYCEVEIPGTENDQTYIFKKWPETQLYQQRNATVHKTHTGDHILVTNKKFRNDVEAVIAELLSSQHHQDVGDYAQHSDTHALKFNQRTSEGSTTLHRRWKTVDYIDGDTVNVMLETTVELDGPFLQFLQNKTEARDHVIKSFRALKIECKFDSDNKQLILRTATQPHDVDTSEILENCIDIIPVTFNGDSVCDFHNPEELCRQMEKNLPELRGRFMLISPTDDDHNTQMLIASTDDSTGVVLSFVKGISDDVKDRLIEVNEEHFHAILRQIKWKEDEGLKASMKQCHLVVSPTGKERKFIIFFKGKTANVLNYADSMKYNFKRALLENRPKAVAYVIQAGFEYKVNGNLLQVTIPRSNFKSCFTGLIRFKTILRSEEPLFDLLSMGELNAMFMENEKLHQNKLVIDVDEANGRFTLIGTDDIFPALLVELEGIQQMYQRDEQTLNVTQWHITYISSKSCSDLLEITDDPRMKVKVSILEKENQPAVRITGSKVGVTKVKNWLKSLYMKRNALVTKAPEVKSSMLQKGAFEKLILSGPQQMLLKENSYARSYLTEAYSKEGFSFECDTDLKFVKFGAKKEEDLLEARAYFDKCITTVETNSDDHKWLDPKEAKRLLEDQKPDLTSKMIIYPQKKSLMLIGTKDVAVPVIHVFHQILDEHKEACVSISLTAEEASELHSDYAGKLKTLCGQVKTNLSSETLHLTGAKLHVRKMFGSVCDMLLTLRKSKRAGTSPQMRSFEMDVAEKIYQALKENDSIWNFIAKQLEERGFSYEIRSMRLKLYAGSLSALKNAMEFFPTQIFETRLDLFSEPVVEMKGMKFVVDMLMKKSAKKGRLIVDADNERCTLTVVNTCDIQNLIDEGLQEIKEMYKAEELDTGDCRFNDKDRSCIEMELSNSEPTLKDKFMLQLKERKLKIIASPNNVKYLKGKAEHLVRWRQREAEINRNLPYRDEKLTDLQLEFLQKEEVINYIDGKLTFNQFETDRKTKNLRLYAIKDEGLDTGMNMFWSCLEVKDISLVNEPVLGNLTLKQFKEMLDVQESLHHGKLLVHVDEKGKCLKLICTDDVKQCVLEKVAEIKEKCSKVTHFIPCEYRKWVALRTLYPAVLHQIEKNGVHISFDDQIVVVVHKQPCKNAHKLLEELILKMVEVTFSLSCSSSEVLQTDEGQSLIRSVQKENGCAITLQESDKTVPQEMVDRKYVAKLHLRLSPNTSVRLSQWTSKSGSSVTIIQGELKDLVANTLAIPVVNGHLPACVPNSLKTGSQLQMIKNLNASNSTVTIKNPNWCQCNTVELYWIPSIIRSGKNQEKETIRRIIKEILRKTETKFEGISVSCVFMLESLWQNNSKLLIDGTKCIIRGCQEAFDAQKQSNFDVCLQTDELHSTTVMKILQNAAPLSKKFSLFTEVKKLRDKFSSKSNESQDEPIQPSIKVVVGQLQKQKVDVLVNSVDAMLDLQKGIVSKVLNDSSNGQLQKDCQKSYPKGIRYGEVAVTMASGDLTARCKMVFHGALHDFNKKDDPKEPNEQKCWEVMLSFIYRCMHEAAKRKQTSVAFPVLGTGKLGYPTERVVQVMFNAVEWFFSDNPSSPVKMVLFVVFDKDVAILKHFMAEKMARNYQVNTFLNEGSSSGEARQDIENNIMLQFIENDIRLCQGTSDGILCFWNESQLSDPSTHPLVGDHLKSIEWNMYEKEVRRTGNVRTNGEGFPAKMIIHIKVSNLTLIKAVQLGLKDAAGQHLQTVQIPLLPQDMPNDPGAFVTDLLSVLKAADITRHNICLVTFVVQDPFFFESAVDCLQEISKSSGVMSQIKSYVTSAFSKEPKTMSSTAGETYSHDKDNMLELVVTAKAVQDCNRANDCLKKGIEEINLKRHLESTQDTEGTPVDKETFYKDRDQQKLPVQDQIFEECRVQLHPSIVFNESWNKGLKGVSVFIHDGKTCIEGSLTDMIQALKCLNDLQNKEANTASDGPKKDEEKQPPSIIVKQLHLEAVKYLFGEKKINECCHVENESDSRKKICFIVGPGNEEQVQELKQRIEGMIQEELDLSNESYPVTKEKAIAAAEAAMKDSYDMYIKYQEDKHTLMIFAEDWGKMAKAKRRVMLQFGQSKTTSRGKRRFAEKPETVKSSDSRSEEKISVITTSGSTIAEGKHFVVKVYKTDITELKVDAIVNAANEHLHHGGGVARAISRAAGDKLTQHGNQIVQRSGPIPVTNLVVTESGYLPCKMVFHAVGPEWYKYTDKTRCLDALCCTILRCLCEATNRNIASLAIPSISSSIFGVPEEKCAKMYVRALKSFDTVVDGGSLREVHFVDISDKMVDIILKELETSWKGQSEKAALAKDRDFINDNLDSKHGTKVALQDSVKVQSITQKGEQKQGRHYFSDKVAILVIKADIFQQNADAVVSWEDFTFSDTRNFVRQMLTAGGENYTKGREAASQGIRQIGGIEYGPGGNLAQKHVIFAMMGKESKKSDLYKVLQLIFKMCVENEFQTLVLPIFQMFEQVSRKNMVTLFMESVVDALKDLTKHEANAVLQIQVIDKRQHVVDELTRKLHENCVSNELHDEQGPCAQEAHPSDMENQCTICISTASNPVKLKCGDVFCKKCIETAFKIKKRCPNCQAVCGTIEGNMPKGTMTEKIEKWSLPGFDGYRTIVITYNFPSGTQTDDHPHPGKYYQGTKRFAYLPESSEGLKVLALLKIAWKRRLTFTVGQSVTIGGGDRVTWNEIHHKTNIYGGSAEHGYPDEDYLRRVQDELAQQGVTEDDLGATGT